MMLLDVFNLLVEFAVKVANQPDEPIEYLDQHLSDFFANKEYAERFKNMVYPDQDALRIPNSEAQKKLKQIIMYFYFLNEFAKYLDDRAADVREQRRQILIAIAILDALLTHQAIIAQFWETLSDQYIQYLADRIKMIEIMNSLIPLYQQQAALQHQIALLDQKIKDLDGKILLAENYLSKRYDELIQFSQSRLDAVAKVTDEVMQDHLGVLALGTENLSLLVSEKRTQLVNAERELNNYLKADPQNLAGKRDAYEASVKKAGAELNQVTEALNKYETRVREWHEKRESIKSGISQLKEKILTSKSVEEKKALSEQLENKTNELVNFTKGRTTEAKNLISEVYNPNLKNLTGVDSSIPEKMISQLKDFSSQLTKADRTKSEEISYKQTSIAKKNVELDTHKAEKAAAEIKRAAYKEKLHEVDAQIETKQQKIQQKFEPAFDFAKLKKASIAIQSPSYGQIYEKDGAKPSDSAPRNTSPKI